MLKANGWRVEDDKLAINLSVLSKLDGNAVVKNFMF